MTQPNCNVDFYVVGVCSAISLSFMAYVLIRNKCGLKLRNIMIFILFSICYLIALTASLYRIIKQRIKSENYNCVINPISNYLISWMYQFQMLVYFILVFRMLAVYYKMHAEI